MKKINKWILSLILSILAITAISFMPSNSVEAEANTHTVHFNYDYNYSSLSSHLDEGIRSIYKGVKPVIVNDGEKVTPPISHTAIERYYDVTWKYLVNVDTYATFDLDTPITKDITLIAEWTPVNYTIYFTYPNDEDSEIINCKHSQVYNFESSQIELYRPQRPNYIFVNWYKDSALTKLYLNVPAHSESDVVLWPKWTPIEYQINYHTEGDNLYNIKSYNIETEDFTLRAPSRTGYSFLGWFLDDDYTYECTTITNKMSGDIDLYAKWEAIVYRVTYVLPNGEHQVVECKYGETADLPKIGKSIFEVLKTNVSRENITADTIIILTKNNIWYVYFIGLLVVLSIVGVILFVVIRRNRTIKKLRYMYQSNFKKI